MVCKINSGKIYAYFFFHPSITKTDILSLGNDWKSAFPTLLLLENKVAITHYMWKYLLRVRHSFLLHLREVYVCINMTFLLMAWWAIGNRARHSRCIRGRPMIPETQSKLQNWAVLLLYLTSKTDTNLHSSPMPSVWLERSMLFVLKQADYTERSQTAHSGLSLIHFVLRHVPNFVSPTYLARKKYSYKTADLLSFVLHSPCRMVKTKSLSCLMYAILIKQFVKYVCVPPTSIFSIILFMVTHLLKLLSVMKKLETSDSV